MIIVVERQASEREERIVEAQVGWLLGSPLVETVAGLVTTGGMTGRGDTGGLEEGVHSVRSSRSCYIVGTTTTLLRLLHLDATLQLEGMCSIWQGCFL